MRDKFQVGRELKQLVMREKKPSPMQLDSVLRRSYMLKLESSIFASVSCGESVERPPPSFQFEWCFDV
jgi:hypothetical protein